MQARYCNIYIDDEPVAVHVQLRKAPGHVFYDYVQDVAFEMDVNYDAKPANGRLDQAACKFRDTMYAPTTQSSTNCNCCPRGATTSTSV